LVCRTALDPWIDIANIKISEGLIVQNELQLLLEKADGLLELPSRVHA